MPNSLLFNSLRPYYLTADLEMYRFIITLKRFTACLFVYCTAICPITRHIKLPNDIPFTAGEHHQITISKFTRRYFTFIFIPIGRDI